jgi:hypothetical protein
MISSIYKWYHHNDLRPNDCYYSFKFDYDHSSSLGSVTITPSVSNYILSSGYYNIKLLIILICESALAKDYPNYVFDAAIKHIHLN